jgi:Protein of unknown function (DUF3613)
MTQAPTFSARAAFLLLPLTLQSMPLSASEPAPATTPVTARTWLNAQSSGSQASPHKQTLSGPIMSGVYQKMRKQLSSGKGNSEAGSSASNDASGNKDNPLGDLGQVLGNTKP